MILPLFKYSIEKLKFLPRYKKGVLKFNTYSVQYVDPLSLYFEYKDIFDKKIYCFRSNKATPVIIDAGGYIGMSVLFFKSMYPQAYITVFEPDAHIFLVLKKNMETNNLKKVRLINAGLGKINNSVVFYPDAADGGSMYKIDNNKTAKIRIVKLSSYINQPIDLLKMNIEGAEGEVFKEIEDKLHFVKEIIFEYHAFSNLPQNLGNILKILDKHNFRYVVADAPSSKIPIPFTLPKKYRYFNLVYAKK